MNAPRARSPLPAFVLMLAVIAVLIGYGIYQGDQVDQLRKSCPAVTR